MQSPSPRRGQHAPAHAEEDRGRNGFNSRATQRREQSLDRPPKSSAAESDKKAGKSKDLSHVPCKFFRQGSCTAGACPFSHQINAPGAAQTKAICQWYSKGNCKFGHKCALAHILPGQPLSWDRKNKRAAQAALREAGEAVVAPNSPQQNGVPTAPSSGIGRSLVDAREGAPAQGDGAMPPGTPPRKSNLGPSFSPVVGHSPRYDANPNEREDLAFGFPDDFDVGPDPPVLAYRSSTDSPSRPSPLNGSSLFAPSSPTLSGLSQTLQNGLSPRPAITQHGALSSSQRRITSNIREASPSRLQQLNPTSARKSFGAHETLFPSATPLAVPGATNINAYGQTSSSGIFGTSPFSGSRSLFMPSSYDSDDAFPRSPKPKSTNLLDDPRRGASSPWDRDNARHVGVFDDDDDEEYDEGFLPSSLNELLTPDEQRRRAARMSTGASQFSPFHASQSVPAVFHLAGARGESTLRTSNSFIPSKAWDTNDSTPNSTYSPPLVPRSLLSVGQPSSLSASLDQPYAHQPASPSLRAQILVKNNYSASFDPSSNFGIRYQPGQEFSPKASPKTLAKNLGLLSINSNGNGHAMGSSLPKGLAAGLSTLHFIPAVHSGETPPTTNVFPSSNADDWENDQGFAHQRQETIRGSTYANLLSGSPSAPGARPTDPSLLPSSALKHSAVETSSFSPPPPSNRSVEHDEIQFDMED